MKITKRFSHDEFSSLRKIIKEELLRENIHDVTDDEEGKKLLANRTFIYFHFSSPQLFGGKKVF
jgi:hypothetical protein